MAARTLPTPDGVYWATLPTDELLPHLVEYEKLHGEFLRGSGLWDLWWRSAQMYQWAVEYNRIYATGKDDEFRKMVIAEYGNIARHILVNTTGARPDCEPRAMNGDYRARAESLVAKGVLEYYFREQHVELRHYEANEVGLLCGEEFLYTRWDPKAGQIAEVPNELLESGPEAVAGASPAPGPGLMGGQPSPGPAPQPFAAPLQQAMPVAPVQPGANMVPQASGPMRGGDIRVSMIHPSDVIRDWTTDKWEDVTWTIVRERANRYDLAAQYPQLRDEILAVEGETEDRWKTRSIRLLETARRERESDMICVYTFLHAPSPALPTGRIVMYLDDTTALDEGTFAQRKLEKLEHILQRSASAEMRGSPCGYTWMWDLMALNDAVNFGHSTALTNLATFGTTNLTGPQGATPYRDRLAEGLNYIGLDGRGEGKVEILDLVYVPEALVAMIERWEQKMETLSGVNSVARGNPEASLKSGAALALVQSQFIEFTKAFEAARVYLWELSCTAMVRLFQHNVPEERLSAIMGKGNRAYVKAVKGPDIANIDRVQVDLVPHLARTAAGRRDLADTLLSKGLIKAEEYVHVLRTGELDSQLHDDYAELDMVELENEILMEGGTTAVLAWDNHVLHINKHRALSFDPGIRMDPNLVTSIGAHILEHVNQLTMLDPRLAAIIGLPAVPGPMQGAPAAPPDQGGQPKQGGAHSVPLPANNPVTGQPGSVQMPQSPLEQAA